MRFSLTASLLLFVMLLIGLGCQDHTELQLPLGGASCRIVKVTYKAGSLSGSKADYEKLAINGKTYEVYTREVRQYKYDDKNQLVQEINTNRGGYSDLRYIYTSTKIFTKQVSATTAGVIAYTSLDTIPLNAQGYDDKYIYSEEGHLLT